MKKYRLAFLFTQAPFGNAVSREGLDALLAASAFCDEEEIAICFLNDGVFNLVDHQQPELIGQKDHIATFKLIELYDLPHCFACKHSAESRRLQNADYGLSTVQWVDNHDIFYILNQAEKVLCF